MPWVAGVKIELTPLLLSVTISRNLLGRAGLRQAAALQSDALAHRGHDGAELRVG